MYLDVEDFIFSNRNVGTTVELEENFMESLYKNGVEDVQVGHILREGITSVNAVWQNIVLLLILAL